MGDGADGAARRSRAFPVALLLACVACEVGPREPRPARPPPAPPPAEPAAEPIPGGGTYVDFQWAVEPDDPVTRGRRLEAWIERYDPDVHGLEDAVHARYWRIAHYRLLQARYRAGRLEAADSILAILEATDAEVR